jgi:hypothetical protein
MFVRMALLALTLGVPVERIRQEAGEAA